jgi:four helix bundle protein
LNGERKPKGGAAVTEEELKKRFKQFALRVLRLVRALPNTAIGRTIGGQLVRCGTSPGANYRAVCRARSRADFVAKMAIVEEETDESAYWMELIIEDGLLPEPRVGPLLAEANELVAIAASSRATASRKIAGRFAVQSKI